jgi:acetyl-CoA acyltransferase
VAGTSGAGGGSPLAGIPGLTRTYAPGEKEPAFADLLGTCTASAVMTSRKAAELGFTPLARLHAFATCGVDPVLMLTGPIPATAKVLGNAGLSLADIGAFEVNEAFAAVLGAWYAETGAPSRATNPLGGAIALGHPLGASGARIATTLVHHMRRAGTRYGLQTMCEGGGMANAIVFELAVK